MSGTCVEVVVILALIIANGLFAGAEIAILSVRKVRLAQLVEERVAWAQHVDFLRRDPERFLSTVQIGITVVGATAAAYGGSTLARDVEQMLAWLPWESSHAPQLALGIVVGGISYLSLVVGELVPKSLALRSPEPYARAVAGPLRRLSGWMLPIVWLLTRSSNLILSPFGDRTTFTESRMSREDLARLVDEAAASGALDTHTRDVTHRALRFSALTAADVAIPRPRIVALPRDAGRDQIIRALESGRHSRMPVYEGTLDHVLGFVASRDIAALALSGRDIDLGALARPVPVIPVRTPAADVLRLLQGHPGEMALLVDEQGIVSGLLTIEDLVEELVGEVLGEQVPEPSVRVVAPGVALVRGDVPTRDVNGALSLALPEGDGWTTIAGLCIHLAGWIPRPGAVLTAADGVELEVMDATDRVVEMVRIRHSTPVSTRPAD